MPLVLVPVARHVYVGPPRRQSYRHLLFLVAHATRGALLVRRAWVDGEPVDVETEVVFAVVEDMSVPEAVGPAADVLGCLVAGKDASTVTS